MGSEMRFASLLLAAVFATGICCRAAADVPLRALRGYSVEAEYWTVESYLLIRGKQQKTIEPSYRYLNRIYVSNSGRIFLRRSFYDEDDFNKPAWSYDNLEGDGGATTISYDASKGFIYRNIPADDKSSTTYVETVYFKITAMPTGFSCATNVKWALKQGETRFVAKDPVQTRIKNWFKVTRSSCRIRQGNVLAP